MAETKAPRRTPSPPEGVIQPKVGGDNLPIADMLMSLRLRQTRLHEIEGVVVEYCGVSEGITQSPRL